MKDNSLSLAIFYSSSKTELIRAARTFNSGFDLLFFQEHNISCFPPTDQDGEDGYMHCNCLNFVNSNVTQNDHKMEADNYEVFTIVTFHLQSQYMVALMLQSSTKIQTKH